MRTTWPTCRQASADIVIVPKSGPTGRMGSFSSIGDFNGSIPDQNAEARQFQQEERRRREENKAN